MHGSVAYEFDFSSGKQLPSTDAILPVNENEAERLFCLDFI
jgi:hypothetical protein